MEIVQIVGIVFAAVVILILAYLYRESAIIEGKTEIAIVFINPITAIRMLLERIRFSAGCLTVYEVINTMLRAPELAAIICGRTA